MCIRKKHIRTIRVKQIKKHTKSKKQSDWGNDNIGFGCITRKKNMKDTNEKRRIHPESSNTK